MGNEQSVKLINQVAAAAAAAETDNIDKTLFYIDNDDDALILFNTRSQKYAISIILQDSSNLGWMECQAIADCMRVAAAGTTLNLQIFQQSAQALREKYTDVQGPAVLDNGTHVIKVHSPRGKLRDEPKTDCLQGVKIAADKEKLTMFAKTNASNVFMVRMPTPNNSISPQLCTAFVKVLTVLEPGDLLTRRQFVNFGSNLKTEFGNVELSGGVQSGMKITLISINYKSTRSGGSNVSSLGSSGSSSNRSTTSDGCPYEGYKYRKLLANSGQARVYAGVSEEDGKSVAIKVFHVDDSSSLSEALSTYRTELKLLLRSSGHPNVVNVLAFFETPRPAVVMEMVPGENVREYIEKHGPLSEKDAVTFARGIADGLVHLHNLGIIHRDLKSPNVLRRSDGAPVIIDLGLSSIKTSNLSKAAITECSKGSPIWMSPEMIKNQQWSDRTDVYAFGLILWELLVGRMPFVDMIADTPATAELANLLLLRIIIEGKRPSLSGIRNSKLRQLISLCWHDNPSRRPSMKQVQEMLGPGDAASVFKHHDENNDGSIDFTEFAVLLRKHAPGKVQPNQMVTLFNKIDRSNTGKIEFNEFEQFWETFQRDGIESMLNGTSLPPGLGSIGNTPHPQARDRPNAELDDVLKQLQKLLSNRRS